MKPTDKRPAAGLQIKRVANTSPSCAGAAGKAVARLQHEVRHERPITDWGGERPARRPGKART